MGEVNQMMDYFMLAIGLYLIYAGIVGKGKTLFNHENVHRSKKYIFLKYTRIFAFIAGPLAVASSVLILNKLSLAGNIVSAVFAAVVFAMIIFNVLVTDRHIKKRCAKLNIEEPASDGYEEAHPEEKKEAAASSQQLKQSSTMSTLNEMNNMPRTETQDDDRTIVDKDDIRFY